MNELTRKRRGQNGATLLSQRGIVVPIVVIGLLAILAVAGLALDGSHALTNKTRIQNTVDAAALAAAKVLDDTDGDTGLATAEANSLFSINAGGAGNHELNEAYGAGDITVTVQYSSTLDPFVPGSFVPGSTSWFVRVIAAGFDTRTSLSSVLGITEIPTPATAVAGPSGPLGIGGGGMICDIAPIAVCANDALDGDENKLRVLKPEPGVHEDIGPGNYKMLRLDDCGAGGACLRQHMAGSYDQCLSDLDDVDTEPGVSSGPVSQGFNTRFNRYQGAGLNAYDYPPDQYVSEQDIDPFDPKVLKSCNDPVDATIEHIFLTDPPANNYCQGFDPYAPDYGSSDWFADRVIDNDAGSIPYNYEDYSGAGDGQGPQTTAGDCGGCTPLQDRRVLRLPRIECGGAAQQGQTTIPLAEPAFACFFMVQSLESGQADGAGNIFGQFLGTCEANGTQGINPGGGPAGPLLYKIQLYKDPDSADS